MLSYHIDLGTLGNSLIFGIINNIFHLLCYCIQVVHDGSAPEYHFMSSVKMCTFPKV